MCNKHFIVLYFVLHLYQKCCISIKKCYILTQRCLHYYAPKTPAKITKPQRLLGFSIGAEGGT